MENSNSHSWIVFKENSVSLKDSYRTIMELVALFYLELHQMDVIMVFLNGNIEETIYMVQTKTLCLDTQRVQFANWKKPFMDSSKHLVNGTKNLIN